jgi:hypothetical protein
MGESIIACCGLDCAGCRAYVATKAGDAAALSETARLWSNEEEGAYTAEDIPCEGCHSERLHAFCARCPVRACARGRGFDNCATCSEYPCGKLEKVWSSWTDASPAAARANLELHRDRLHTM